MDSLGGFFMTRVLLLAIRAPHEYVIDRIDSTMSSAFVKTLACPKLLLSVRSMRKPRDHALGEAIAAHQAALLIPGFPYIPFGSISPYDMGCGRMLLVCVSQPFILAL